MEAAPLSQRACQQLRQAGDALFAVVDCAHDPTISRRLGASRGATACLFDGHPPPELTEVAPTLVDLRADNGLVAWLTEQGWGRSWTSFWRCSATLPELRKHLRRLLTVRTPTGPALFRFYDPRVLRAYLPTCTPEEVAQVLGPIEVVLVEGDSPSELLAFSHDGAGGLTRNAIDLTRAEVSPLESSLAAPTPEQILGIVRRLQADVDAAGEAAARAVVDEVRALGERTSAGDPVIDEHVRRALVRLETGHVHVRRLRGTLALLAANLDALHRREKQP